MPAKLAKNIIMASAPYEILFDIFFITRLDYRPLFGKWARAPPPNRRLDSRVCYCQLPAVRSSRVYFITLLEQFVYWLGKGTQKWLQHRNDLKQQCLRDSRFNSNKMGTCSAKWLTYDLLLTILGCKRRREDFYGSREGKQWIGLNSIFKTLYQFYAD